jgi:hypothetical protein
MTAATTATATTASAVVILMSRSVTGSGPGVTGFAIGGLKICDELGELNVGNAAQFANL